MSTTPLLSVSDLTVSYGRTEVVHSIGFTLHAGQSLGIIGESGSGKSTTARAILRLLDTSATVGGEIRLHGNDVQLLDDRRFRSLRGVRLGLVPQDPGTALNPVRTIGSQAHEAAALAPREAGESPSERAREKARILAVFDRVGLPDPQAVYDSYPHQLSGGMLQRVLIGLAVLPEPDLLIADEPTSALDVTVQRRILDLLDELRASLNIGLILITHDLAIAAERTDSLVVLRDGRIVEQGPTQQVLRSPTSAYTVNLRNAVPSLNPDRYVERRRHRSQVTNEHPTVGQATELASVITAENLSRTFTSAGRAVSALADLSFKVPRGTTHALVGESGSGKTTAVRILVGLETLDSGQVTVGGHVVTGPGQRRQTDLYRRLQIVYQNPFTSLDPTWSVARIIREPLDRFRVGSRSRRRERAAEALHSVGLDTAVLGRRAGTLSGGQRQRVAIARALALEPEVLVLDEPTSALDVSVQAEIFDLLIELQAEKGLTYLVVSHDLPLIRQVADTVTVMRHGRAVESGAVADVFTTPSHGYTRALLAATPDHAGIRADAVPVA